MQVPHGCRRWLFACPRLGDDRLAVLAAAGDERAFEAIYDRHHRALLGFCRHMLGTREEAEDALQQTFLRAHGALAARGAPAELRPWLFTIARNCCLTMLSARRPVADGERELASAEGLGDQVQVRADLRAVVADVERLPDEQRAALVLAELADLSHDQIAEVIGVRAGKVKALIHQARTTLIAEREARDTPCAAIREQLSTARGGALRRGPLRRHLRQCDGCRAYREAVSEQRRALALVLPVTPSLGLKAGILGAASATGGAAAVGGAASSVAARRPWVARRRSAAAWRRRSSRGRSSSAAPPRAGSRSSTIHAPHRSAHRPRRTRPPPRPSGPRWRSHRRVALERAAKPATPAPERRAARGKARGRDKPKPARSQSRPAAKAVPPGQAKRTQPAAAKGNGRAALGVPPGQAKKQAAPPVAKPVKVKKEKAHGNGKPAVAPLPTAAPKVPPGQLKKSKG